MTEIIDEYCYYKGKLIICSDCKSSCVMIRNASVCSCHCGGVQISMYGNHYEYSFIDQEGNEYIFDGEKSIIILYNQARIRLKNYCVINKTKEDIMKQMLLL